VEYQVHFRPLQYPGPIIRQLSARVTESWRGFLRRLAFLPLADALPGECRTRAPCPAAKDLLRVKRRMVPPRFVVARPSGSAAMALPVFRVEVV